ncbi:MAG: hypothetical protein JSV95_02000 [Gemmatimonadota bacterium]|nr:MAG: hypothetical protein JSV95_02000 [Gemmatimonadota bacterium]
MNATGAICSVIGIGLLTPRPIQAKLFGGRGPPIELARAVAAIDDPAPRDTVERVGTEFGYELEYMEYAADAIALLRAEAAELHCCTTETFLEAAAKYEWAAEHGLATDSRALDDLRLAAYFYYYGGQPDRAINSLTRLGEIARERGERQLAGQAFREAAHVARLIGDAKHALEFFLIAEELSPQDAEQ